MKNNVTKIETAVERKKIYYFRSVLSLSYSDYMLVSSDGQNQYDLEALCASLYDLISCRYHFEKFSKLLSCVDIDSAFASENTLFFAEQMSSLRGYYSNQKNLFDGIMSAAAHDGITIRVSRKTDFHHVYLIDVLMSDLDEDKYYYELECIL